MEAYTFSPPEGGDVDHGWALLSVCWAFVLCAFITTSLRIFVRAKLTKNLGYDDAFMVIAMITTLLGAGMITAAVLNGLGRHMYYLQPSEIRIYRAVGWADWVQTFLTLMFTKISICLFLMRIVESKKFRIFLWSVIGSLVLFTAVCSIIFLAVCRPLRAYWDTDIQGVCLSETQVRNMVIAQGVLSIVTDLICAAFPAIFLRGLQVRLRTKIGLCILMGLGVITAACCTVRTVLSGALTDPDITWAISTNVAWRLPEVNIGIVCANAPILRSIYLFYHGKLATQQVSNAKYASENKWPSTSDPRSYNSLGHPLSDTPFFSPSGNASTGTRDTQTSVELGLPVQRRSDQV